MANNADILAKYGLNADGRKQTSSTAATSTMAQTSNADILAKYGLNADGRKQTSSTAAISVGIQASNDEILAKYGLNADGRKQTPSTTTPTGTVDAWQMLTSSQLEQMEAENEARKKNAAPQAATINQSGNPNTSAKDYTAMADALEAEAKELFKEYSALTSAPRRGATPNLAQNRQEAARKLREYDEKQQEVKRLRESAAKAIRQQLDSVTQQLKETRETAGKVAGRTGYDAHLHNAQLTEQERALESQRRALTTKLKESGGELTAKEKLANVGTGVSDFFNSVVSGGDLAWGGLFGTLAMVDEATGNAMNKIARTVTGNEKYGEPFVSPFREYADYHNGQAADTLARASEGRGKFGQQVMETGQSIGNMLANSSLSGLTGGTGAGMGVTFGTSSAGLNASTAQKGIAAVTNAAARLGNGLLSNQTNALISAGSAGHKYIEATNRGADQDKAMSNAILVGLQEYFSNKMFSGTPLEDTGEKGYVTKLIEYATDKVGKREALGTFLNSPLGKGASFAFDKIGEGFEEVITVIGDPLAERITWNPKADLATVDEIVDSFIDGLSLSLMMSGGEAVIDNTVKVGNSLTSKISDYVDNAIARSRFVPNPIISDEYVEDLPIGEISVDEVNQLIREYGINLTGYEHVLTDNDIRHMYNRHGPHTKEKFPITAEDIKKIPTIIRDADDVYFLPRSDGKKGLMYRYEAENTTYYLEEIVDTEKKLRNKQMIKVPTGEIPDIKGLRDAINKKSINPTPDDAAKAVPQMYAQDVKIDANNSIVFPPSKVNAKDAVKAGKVDLSSYTDAFREHTAQMSASYADMLREILQSTSQQDTPYSDALRRILDELGGFREP